MHRLLAILLVVCIYLDDVLKMDFPVSLTVDAYNLLITKYVLVFSFFRGVIYLQKNPPKEGLEAQLKYVL